MCTLPKALSHVKAGHANIICMAEPAATAVLAYVVLGERMETMQIIGAIAVIVGVLILQLGPKALAKPPPSHRGAA
ncbi:MAG: DMT family transporter [Firmicutes bacterium]|nr:DMT family transporter [Bacillota bacterium]